MRRWTLLWIATLLALCAGSQARAADPDALWKIVAGACVPHQRDEGTPKPCETVDLDGGYAVLKDRVGATQFLLIPTTRIGGIESPEVLAPGAPAYWAAAWAARRFVMARAGRDLPRDMIGLAINSVSGRSQNQLHIHVDCIAADVRRVLRAHEAAIGDGWTRLPVTLDGHGYMARRLVQAGLEGADPFRLLAAGPGGPDMAHETLVVIGARFGGTQEGGGQDGFVLLADHADAASGDRASGEELLDHACAVAREAG